MKPHLTHEVVNQPTLLDAVNWYNTDPVLGSILARGPASWVMDRAAAFGELIGGADVMRLANEANRNPPELMTHDPQGHRRDQVQFHPAYHALMAIAVHESLHCLPWSSGKQGAHAARSALFYLFNQLENGVACPISMTYACVPALRQEAGVFDAYEDKLMSSDYDARFLPPSEKRGMLIGMAMTEKQGGSDVRANTTKAIPAESPGRGRIYYLTGHKWFCSAPMCDGFLTLAQCAQGLSCFFVPRWTEDGTCNSIRIQRLKDKLGNRSNASSEIEYDAAWARMVGQPGRGVATILEMVAHTRLDCMTGSTGIMRHALVQAIHHCRGRQAFGELLIDQPLMRNVLTDLALEWEAALRMTMHTSATYDDPDQRSYGRLVTALGKFWICKRTPLMVSEALECLGGNGYVEEFTLARMYREAPLNSIWEGSGNVIALDVLRTLEKKPDAMEALIGECESARGFATSFDRLLETFKRELVQTQVSPSGARRFASRAARLIQAALMIRDAPESIARAFCESRIDSAAGDVMGSTPFDTSATAAIDRAYPRS